MTSGVRGATRAHARAHALSPSARARAHANPTPPRRPAVAFANAQRIHYNYVEGAASAILFSIVSGVYFPRYSAAASVAYMVGREAFAAGYASKTGPNNRIVGALILDLALVAMIGLSVAGAVRHAKLF